MEEADIERFPNGAKVEEIVMKEHGQKSKLFGSMLGRERTVVKRKVVDMLFLHFIAYDKISREAAQQLISNSIDSQMILPRHLSQLLGTSHQSSLM